MRVISEIYKIEKGDYKYLSYSDKDMKYEEEYHLGDRNKICTYSSNKTNACITKEIDVNRKFNMFTLMHDSYIFNTKSIPSFEKVSKDTQYKITFDINGRIMDGGLSFPEDVYTFRFDNNVFFTEGMIEDPYDIENKLFNYVTTTDNGLFIQDFKNKEFYTLNSRYQLKISGKVCKYGIKEFKDGSDYIIWKYNDNGDLYYIYNQNKPEDECIQYITKTEEDCDEPYSYTKDYCLPFVYTSYGAEVLTDPNSMITCNEDYFKDENFKTHIITYRYITPNPRLQYKPSL